MDIHSKSTSHQSYEQYRLNALVRCPKRPSATVEDSPPAESSTFARLSFVYEDDAKLYVKRRIDPHTTEITAQFPSPDFVEARTRLQSHPGSIIDLIV